MSNLKEHTILGTIYYPDIDCNNHIRCSALMRNFQQVGGRHLVKAGTPPEELLKSNLAFMVIRQEMVLNCNIIAGCYNFTTWVEGTSGANFIRNYEMTDESGNQLAVCSSAWIIIDMSTRKIIRPDRFESSIPYLPERKTQITDPGKFKLPEGLEPVCELKPRFSDMDSNQHINNAIYGDFASEALFNLGINKPIKRQKIYFKHEAVAEETFIISAKAQHNIVYICGDVKADGRRSFEAELTLGN